jgi:two-component system cell cycle sensor histidine kinase/response regulator CckA
VDRSALPVVVFAPTGRDAALVTGMLMQEGHVVVSARSPQELYGALGGEVGTAVIAEEALRTDGGRCLLEALAEQPSWSDLPLVVLTSPRPRGGAGGSPLSALRSTANVTLLERPVQPVTLLSAVRTALRARARQHQVRDYLAERARSEEQLRRAQRMEAVGKLAGGVAHEVNNMMAVVLGFGEFALQNLDADHPSRLDVEEMIKAGGRAAAITQQLLAFSRRQHQQPTVLDLAAVVRELSKLLVQVLGAEYQLEMALSPAMASVRADRTQIEQVLVNLVLNARDAMQPGGRVSITGDTVELDQTYALSRHGIDVRTGPYVMLAVSDTGSGMDAIARDRAFDPFFTTKPVGQGTGLGLSTVYGIVKQSHGYVWLYSEPGQGTTVKIYLPALASGRESAAAGPPPLRRGHETILVVEDEEVVRRLARRTLEENGYTVLEAENGRAALDVLAHSADGIELVLCDVVMPSMNGRELATHIAVAHPGIRVLFMSGYTGEDVAARGLLAADAPFVQKPFTANALGQKIRELLDPIAP